MNEPGPLPPPRLHLAATMAVEWADGRRLPLAARDAVLLAWLALEGPTPRARLAALLWPEHPAEAARNALRQRLFQLRRQCGVALADGTTVLALTPGLTHDLDDGEALLATLTETLPPALDAWLSQRRSDRAERVAARADAAESVGDWPAALHAAQRLLSLQPVSEAAHRRLIRLLYLAGDRAAALLAFDRCEQRLKDEVGMRPGPETLALLATIESAVEPARQPAARAALPAALLRPPRLIGREAECDALTGVLAEGGAAVLIGEAGLGKSRLLAEVATRHVGAGGAPLLALQARPGDAAVPYTTLLRCLRALQAHGPAPAGAAALAHLMPELGAPPPGRDDNGLALLEALQAWLGAVAGRVGGLLLDDLHFIDAASADLLRGALAGDAPPLALLVATRPQASDAGEALRRSLSASALELPLGPLDPPTLAALLASLALPGLDAVATAPSLHRLTGGNPLFVLEALKLSWREGLPAVQARPGGVQQLIGQRLQTLSPDALALARLAAMAGPDFDIALAEALLHTPALRLADAWTELEQAQVLRGAQFAHDLVFEAVLQGVPAPIAGHTHRALAAWLEARDGDPARVAAHWHAAGDLVRCIAPWRQAAERALRRGLPAEARLHLESAAASARETGRGDDEFEVLDQLHFVYALDDPGPAHEALVERLQALARSPWQRLVAADSVHDMRRRRGLPPDLDGLRADLAAAQSLGDEDLTGSLVNQLIGGLMRAGLPDEAMVVHEQNAAVLERDPDPVDRCTMLGNLGAILSNLDRFAEADRYIRQALALAEQHAIAGEVMVVMSNRLRLLRGQGRRAALDWIEAIDRQHAVVGDNLRSWVQSRMGASEVLREAGRFREAMAMLQIERERLPLLAGVLAPAWSSSEVALWLALGQHARALQAARAVTEVQFADAPPWLQARLRLALAQARARAVGEGLSDRPDAESWALLNEAAERAPRQSRRSIGFEIQLQRAAWSEPDAGLALAEGVMAATQALGLHGLAAHAGWLALARALDAGRLAAAVAAGERAQAAMIQVFEPGRPAEPVLPAATTPGWVDAQRVRLARALGRPDAEDLAQAARGRLRDAAEAHIDPAFRDAFLHRHPAHAALRA